MSISLVCRVLKQCVQPSQPLAISLPRISHAGVLRIITHFQRKNYHIRPYPLENSGSRPLSHRQTSEGQTSSWVGDDQRIPGVVCFCFLGCFPFLRCPHCDRSPVDGGGGFMLSPRDQNSQPTSMQSMQMKSTVTYFFFKHTVLRQSPHYQSRCLRSLIYLLNFSASSSPSLPETNCTRFVSSGYGLRDYFSLFHPVYARNSRSFTLVEWTLKTRVGILPLRSTS